MSYPGEVLDALGAFDVAEYIALARKAGRAQVPGAWRERASALYVSASQVEGTARHHLSSAERDLLDLGIALFESEHFLAQGQKPRYRYYANIPVLMRAAGLQERTALGTLFARLRTAIALLLADVWRFEHNSAKGLEPYNTESYRDDLLPERQDRLSKVMERAAISLESLDPTPAAPPESLQAYVGLGRVDRVLRFLTLFPQTPQHDEVLFIRAIHVSELSFYGAAVAVWEARSRLLFHQEEEAASLTREAVDFVRLLIPLFQFLYVMPWEHFADGFRDATGDASAIQSRGYQLLDAILRGIPDDFKAEALAGIPEVDSILAFGDPQFVPFSTAVNLVEDSTPAAQTLTDARNQLLKWLGGWRSLHTSRAHHKFRYLPPAGEGTGGTAGYTYLRDQSFPGRGSGVTTDESSGNRPYLRPTGAVPYASSRSPHRPLFGRWT